MMNRNRGNASVRSLRTIGFRVGINLLVFCVLLLAVEMLLRTAGARSLHRIEKEDPLWESRYGEICRKIRRNNLVFYDTFASDADGIFKLNPATSSGNVELFPSARFSDLQINAAGFRGNEFEKVDTARPRLLLIGDSFTWGAAADPLYNSFADRLQRNGYHVYNAGIPGTDPGQYARIAAKYVPRLRPQVTVVCLYLGNDLRLIPHPVQPGANLHYFSNAGFLRGYDDRGRYFENQAALLRHIRARKCGDCRSIIDYFFFQTVLGKGVYLLLHPQRLPAPDRRFGWVRDALLRIADVTRRESSRLMIFLIPMAPWAQRESHAIERIQHLFSDLEWFFPHNFDKNDYCRPPNRHFNNGGHLKFARFITDRLSAAGYPPMPAAESP